MIPLCTEQNCNVPQRFQKGCLKGKCGKHGGLLCIEYGCVIPQNYNDGGIVGKCAIHGLVDTQLKLLRVNRSKDR